MDDGQRRARGEEHEQRAQNEERDDIWKDEDRPRGPRANQIIASQAASLERKMRGGQDEIAHSREAPALPQHRARNERGRKSQGPDERTKTKEHEKPFRAALSPTNFHH